jgi:V8-like Glu-specific endopeptidase
MREPAHHFRQVASVIAAAAMAAFLLAAPSDTAAAAGVLPGTPFRGNAAVGALFLNTGGKLGPHFCTASVVHSPHGDLLMTAAHCMVGKNLHPAGNIVFAPGYHRGKFPHGVWQVTAKYVDRMWYSARNPNDDVAFLRAGGRGRHIERLTGAEVLDEGQHLPVRAEVIGYPDVTNRPITCTGPARSYDPGPLRQVVFDCGGYTDGTSGGPFLAHVSARTGYGSVFGVIGGYQQGGNTPSISYSSKFLANVLALYRAAASG